MKNRAIFHVFVLLAGILSSAAPSKAATLTLTGVGLGQYPVPLITNHGSGLTPENAYAVQILVTLNGTPYIAYCVDLFTPISLATYNATYGVPADYTNGLRAAWILNTYGPSVLTNQDGAALQVALWDVVHDGGDGLSAGNVQMSPSGSATLRSAIEGIVTASFGQTSTNATILYTASLSGAPAQTLITSGNLSDVPEPSTLAFVAIGGVLIAARRRWS